MALNKHQKLYSCVTFIFVHSEAFGGGHKYFRIKR